MRTLQLLQDRVAAGSLSAHEGQLLMIVRINEDLLQAAPEVWADGHNVQAAIVFALSGGGPAILRRLIARAGIGEPEATLARGALAYVEGQRGRGEPPAQGCRHDGPAADAGRRDRPDAGLAHR